MVQRKRMVFSGLVVASAVAMFMMTDALDIGDYSAAKQD